MAAPIRLGITIHADGSAQVSGELNRVRGGLNETDRATQSASRSFAQMARETLSLKAVIAGFAASLSALALFQTTKELIRTADNMTLLDGRIKIATSSQADYIGSSKELVAISLRTGTSFEANATIFSRINKAMEQMGGTTAHTTALTETLAQSLRISGTSAGEAASVIRQMSQALASGVLRGDEFNSLMENSPRLAQAMADGMHVNIGSLRAMAEAGELTSKRVITAIQSQADVINEEFKRIPLTVGSALENINTAFSQYILAANSSSGATFELAHTINTLAENLPLIINSMITLGKVAAIIFVGSAISGIAGYFQAMASARAEAAALASTIAAASAANLAQAEALVIGSQAAVAHASATAADLQATQAIIVAVRAQSLAQFSATNQQILRTRAEITALSATIQTTATIYLRAQAEAALAVAEARRAALQADLAMLGTQYSAVSVKVTEALAAQTAANMALAEAETALTAAQTGLTASTVSFGASLKVLLTPLNLINVALAAFVGWEIGKWLYEFPTIAGMAAISMGFFAKVVESFNFHLAVNEARLTGNSEAIAGLRAEHDKAVSAIDSNVQGTVLFIESQGQAVTMSTDLKQALAALKTPQEVYAQKVLETNEALKSNLITQEQATSLLAKYKETLDQANASMKESPFTKELDKQIDRLNKATLSAKEYDRATFKKAGFSGNELDSLMAKSGSADAAEAQIAATKKLASERKTAADAEERAVKSAKQASVDYLKALQNESNQIGMTAREKADYAAFTIAERMTEHNWNEILVQGFLDKAFAENLALEAAQKAAAVKEQEKTEMDGLIDKYNQLTLSAREYYSLTLLKKGIAPDKQAPLLQQFDKTTQAEAQQKSIDDARSALESYNAQLSKARENLSGLGATSADVFNSSLGGINALSGAFNAMVDAIAKNTTALAELHKRQLQNADFEKKALTDEAKRKNPAQFLKDQKTVADNKIAYINEEAKLGNERLMAELGGIRQIATATGQMFAENTTARKAFNLVALAASVAERAADLAGLGVKAASAVLTQGQGDPYTAFARIAAMAAIVASVIAAAGGGAFQFGGSVGKRPEVSTDTGTVLGDSAAKSESIDKTYQLLKDIHAEEYAELRGINNGISNLQSGIASTATNLFRAGGLKTALVAPDYNAANAFTKSLDFLKKGTQAIFGKQLGGIISDSFSILSGKIVTDFLLGGILGKVKQKVVGGGITTDPALLGGTIQGQQYTTIETTKKSWFSKKVSYSEMLSPLEASVSASLSKVFANIAETTTALGDTLFKQTGLNFRSAIKNYVVPSLKIELYGLTGDEAAKKLSGVLSATTDQMATDIFGAVLGRFQQLGEGMLQTVIRITAEIAVVSSAIELSGLKLTAKNVIKASDAIVQNAGSIQELQKQVGGYLDKFYSDAERQALGLKKLNGQLLALGLVLPVSREGYRKLIESLDLNNKQDLARYSLLLKLNDAADAYYSGFEQQQSAYADAVTSASDALAAAYKAEADSLSATITKLDEFSRSVKAFRDTLVLGDLSVATPAQKYAEASAQFDATVAAIANGPGATDSTKQIYEQALADMQQKSQSFLTASRTLNASGDAYTADFTKVLAAIGSSASAADSQKTESEKQLVALKQSVTGLIDFSDAVTSVTAALAQLASATAAQASFVSAQATADTLAKNAVYNSKMDAWSKNYAGYNSNVKWNQLTSVNAVYGQFSEQLSVEDWAKRGAIVKAMLKDLNAQAAGEKPLHDLQFYITKANKIDGSHRDGLDFVPFDGYRAELHRGERVQTAQQARADDKLSAELLAELRALRAEVEKLRAENISRTEATIKSNFEATDRAADKVVAGHKDAAKESAWFDRSKADIT